MKRSIYIVAATFLALIIASADIRSPISLAKQEASIAPDNCVPSDTHSCGDEITIIFHGLMVGRHKQRKSRFEVGIVKGSGHDFKLQVWEKAGQEDAVTKDIPDPPINQVYQFEIMYEGFPRLDNSAGIHLPQGQAFDRRRGTAEVGPDKAQDYRYIPDIEGVDLHNDDKGRRRNPFKYVFHALNGTVMSECLTSQAILKKRGNEQSSPYGYVAEIVGVDITLLPGQKLVLKNKKTGVEVWSCSYSKGKKVEARILNLPKYLLSLALALSRTPPPPYVEGICEEHPGVQGHPFTIYYNTAINVSDLDERFNLISPPREQGIVGIRTIYPYLCGMIVQSKTGDDINENDMD